MEKHLVDELVQIRNDLGQLVKAISPEVAAEWECLEKLTGAHKTLRSIDTTELLQMTMPLMTVTENQAPVQDDIPAPPDFTPHAYEKGEKRGTCAVCGLKKKDTVHDEAARTEYCSRCGNPFKPPSKDVNICGTCADDLRDADNAAQAEAEAAGDVTLGQVESEVVA